MATGSTRAIANIVSAVEQTNALIRGIDSATREQTKGIQLVADSMERLRGLAREITMLTVEQGKRRGEDQDTHRGRGAEQEGWKDRFHELVTAWGGANFLGGRQMPKK